MIQLKTVFHICLGALLTLGLFGQPTVVHAQQREDASKPLREPVFRVSKIDQKKKPGHPLDPALKIANDGLAHIHKDVRDYTARIIKRERIGGKLMPQEYMDLKVRQQQIVSGKVVTPFSVYLKFLSPKETVGREVIFVKGKNNGKIVVHEGSGLISYKTLYLDPNGFLAMRGNRYPISEIGVEVLTLRLLEKGNRDRAHGECKVEFFKNATINKRRCTVLRVTHPIKRDYFDFHIAEIFIDDELRVPIRYAAYSWPTKKGGKPVLEEEYTYINVNFNVGLTNADFNPANPKYNYP